MLSGSHFEDTVKKTIFYIHIQGFIQAILMSIRWHKKLNLLIEFSNSIFIKFYFKAFWH